jgi:hypothetical protein
MKILILNILIYSYLLFYISCQIYSITQNSVNVSNYSYNLISNNFFEDTVFKYDNYYSNSAQIEADLQTDKAIYTLTRTNEYGFAKNELSKVYINGNLYRGQKNFYTQYAPFAYPAKRIDDNKTKNINPEPLFQTQNYNSKYMCHNLLGEIFVKANFNISSNKYSKVLTMKSAIFGLNSEKNQIYSINNFEKYYSNHQRNNIYYKYDKEITSECKSGKIVDFFIHNNVMAELSLLENNNYMLCIVFYNIIVSSINEDFMYNKYLTKKLNFNSKVLELKVKNKCIYISLENEKKIIKYNEETLDIVQNYTYQLIKEDIIKFVVLNHTIYAIEKNFGIIIFDINSGGIINKLEYPYAVDIDLFKNPFNGFLFIGIYLNSEYDDFFIELFVKNEFHPSINKILAYNYINPKTFTNYHYKFTNYITFDAQFTYFLDVANNNLLSIRRGLVKEIDFLSFIIPLNTSYGNDAMVYPYKSNGSFQIGIYSNNKYIIFDSFKYKKNQLFCNFNNTKYYYSLIFSHITDRCPETDGNSLLLCKIIDGYSFKIYMPKIKEKSWVTFLLSLFTVSFFFLLLLIIMVYRSVTEKDTGLNLYRNFDINNRQTLYFASGEFNFNANERIQSKEFKDEEIYENDRKLSNLYKHYDLKKKTDDKDNKVNKVDIPYVNFNENEKTEIDDQKVVNISINLMEDSKEKIIHKKKK